jgi:hypothetical protein
MVITRRYLWKLHQMEVSARVKTEVDYSFLINHQISPFMSYWKVGMESLFGRENLAREAAVVRMVQAYEKEIRETARISHILKQSAPMQLAWYCPLLVRLGEMMVSLGTHLKAHYSIEHALRIR